MSQPEQPERVPEKPAESDDSPRHEPIDFRELAHGSREVLIQYDGQIYRLRLTRNGKLILNK